ncbi:TetR/AcrR family transcriptional regulator [Rhodococcus sp. 3Y1]
MPTSQQLGIGHGTFYRYFENKRDIIDHVIDDLVAKIISALATENAPDAASTLDEYRAQVGRIAEALPRIFFDDPASRGFCCSRRQASTPISLAGCSIYSTSRHP